jgi:hypothetical protein
MVKLALQTCAQNDIDNFMNATPPHAGAILEVSDLERRHATARRRPGILCSDYNCHGLTFAARRTSISNGVEKILSEDRYVEVPMISDRLQ